MASKGCSNLIFIKLLFQLAGNDAQGHVCRPFDVIRSSAKGSGDGAFFMAKTSLTPFAFPSIQHCLRGGGKRCWSRRVFTLWAECVELCIAEVAEIVGDVVSHWRMGRSDGGGGNSWIGSTTGGGKVTA